MLEVFPNIREPILNLTGKKYINKINLHLLKMSKHEVGTQEWVDEIRKLKKQAIAEKLKIHPAKTSGWMDETGRRKQSIANAPGLLSKVGKKMKHIVSDLTPPKGGHTRKELIKRRRERNKYFDSLDPNKR